MKRIIFPLFAMATLAAVVEFNATASRYSEDPAPVFVKTIPPGYRDWRLVSVAREEGTLNDIRAILGNDIAIKAYREGKLPFPDGTIIARLAWSHDASEENNKVFGQAQSFTAGAPKNSRSFSRRTFALALDRCVNKALYGPPRRNALHKNHSP